MVFGVRDGNEEGHDSQYQNDESNYEECSHEMLPFGLWILAPKLPGELDQASYRDP
jgi:hypothetical protein